VIDVRRLRRDLSPGSIGIVYVWVLMILAFSFYNPNLFPTMSTVRTVLNLNAMAGLAALAVLVPMATGAIDASVGGNISLSSVSCAYLLSTTSLPVWVVFCITLGIGATIGLANAFVVVVLKIPSIIGTLAMWLICDALSLALAGNQSSLPAPQLSGEFGNVLALNTWQNVSIPVLYLVVLAATIGTVLTQTSTGRHAQAVGLNADVARNTGVRVNAIQGGALVIGGVLSAFAGMVLAAQTASAAPGSGTAYLLPAFAAVFLGATQFRLKRFNAWGTLLAVFMLATGTYGLALAGAAQWVPNVFQGVALIVAIGISRKLTATTVRRPRRERSEPRAGVAVPDLA
jgi:ribose transport system permease protein